MLYCSLESFWSIDCKSFVIFHDNIISKNNDFSRQCACIWSSAWQSIMSCRHSCAIGQHLASLGTSRLSGVRSLALPDPGPDRTHRQVWGSRSEIAGPDLCWGVQVQLSVGPDLLIPVWYQDITNKHYFTLIELLEHTDMMISVCDCLSAWWDIMTWHHSHFIRQWRASLKARR